MHVLFPEWYGICNPNPKEKTIQLRWATVQNIKKIITSENALCLLRTYLALPQTTPDFVSEIISIASKKDISFPARKNTLELSILAGSTIVDILESEMSKRADILAVSCLTYKCCDSRKLEPLSDLDVCAQNYIKNRSVSLRQKIEIQKISYSSWKIDDEIEGIQTAIAANVLSGIEEPITLLSEKMLMLLKGLGKDVNRGFKAFNGVIDQKQEEADILWWLFPGFSTDLDRPYNELKSCEAALVIARELAERIKILPGPLSAKAFIGKMMNHTQQTDESCSILDIIYSSPETWRSTYISGGTETDHDFFPLSFGIIKSLDIPEKESMKVVFETSTKIVLQPVELSYVAYQFYLENILMKLFTQVSK